MVFWKKNVPKLKYADKRIFPRNYSIDCDKDGLKIYEQAK